MDVLFLVVGLALLTGGGEAVIRGSLAAARRLGISPLLTGLVIVGFGTSAPEMVVSVGAAISKRPDIAVGNVVGSNIANILLILGLCALIRPLAVKPTALRRDAVTVVVASCLFLVLVRGNGLGRMDATILISSLAAYLMLAYWSERLHASPAGDVYSAEAAEVTAVPRSVVWTVTILAWIEPVSNLISESVRFWTKRPRRKPTSLATMIAMNRTKVTRRLLWRYRNSYSFIGKLHRR